LISGDLRAAADIIRLSRKTLRTIRQKLGWAFGYNLAALLRTGTDGGVGAFSHYRNPGLVGYAKAGMRPHRGG
jgi:cation transport ATPase